MTDPTLPFDLEAQNYNLQQKRQLAQALQQRTMQAPPQGQMISGRYVAPGIGGLISQIGGGVMSGIIGRQADEAQQEYGKNYSKQLASGLHSYLSTRDGAPGQTMSDSQADGLMNGDQAPTLADPVAANPREAVVKAMSSRIPELAQIGQMDYTNMLRQNMPQFKDVNGQALEYTPGRGVRNLGDFRTPISVNGQLVQPDGKTVGDYRDKFGPVGAVAQPPGGGPAIYGQTQPQTGEVKFAPMGSTFAPDRTGNLEALQQAGKVLDTTRTQFITARGAMSDAQRMMQLAKDPEVNTGFLAGKVTGLQAVGAKLGLNPSESVAKTQALVSNLASRTLEAGKEMKGSFSDKDIEFLKGVSDGSIDLTPQVLQHAAGLSIASAHNSMMNSMEQHDSAGTVTGAGEISKLYPLPGVGNWKLPPDQFEETAPNRFQYKSPLLTPSPGTPQGPARGTAANPMTYEEYMATRKGN